MNANIHLGAAPVIKFPGGKRKLLPEIRKRMPITMGTYFEPFSGGLAVFFALASEGCFKRAVIGDANISLVNLYTQLRDDLPTVVARLRYHSAKHSPEHYKTQSEAFLDKEGPSAAARVIYLSMTCFNGLYRVNRAGKFNVPIGAYKNPRILNLPALRAASQALQGVEIVLGDFEKLLKRAKSGDVAYLDPPYLRVSDTSFTAYHKDGFEVEDHERLQAGMSAAYERGAHLVLSNADTPEARRIFSHAPFRTLSVQVPRNINSNGKGRGKVGEILVHSPMRRFTP